MLLVIRSRSDLQYFFYNYCLSRKYQGGWRHWTIYYTSPLSLANLSFLLIDFKIQELKLSKIKQDI